MGIDEKRLDEWREAIHNAGITSDRELDMLIRLARLGLWAREYGIPALEMGAFHHDACPWLSGKECCCARKKVDLAISSYPKETP